MKVSEAKQGRVFVLRLEDGEILHAEIEAFARQKSIRSAALIVIGGADEGSRLIVGPQAGRASPLVPMERVLRGPHEIAGVGTIFPDSTGSPKLHLHVAAGREDSARAGCVRNGVRVWLVCEVVLFELVDTAARRELDPATGFELLQP